MARDKGNKQYFSGLARARLMGRDVKTLSAEIEEQRRLAEAGRLAENELRAAVLAEENAKMSLQLVAARKSAAMRAHLSIVNTPSEATVPTLISNIGYSFGGGAGAGGSFSGGSSGGGGGGGSGSGGSGSGGGGGGGGSRSGGGSSGGSGGTGGGSGGDTTIAAEWVAAAAAARRQAERGEQAIRLAEANQNIRRHIAERRRRTNGAAPASFPLSPVQVGPGN